MRLLRSSWRTALLRLIVCHLSLHSDSHPDLATCAQTPAHKQRQNWGSPGLFHINIWSLPPWRVLQRFRPMSLERPKVLLPLVGASLIDYTLEWRASNNVAEVRLLSHSSSSYVVCMQGPACEPLDGVQSMHASVHAQVYVFCCAHS